MKQTHPYRSIALLFAVLFTVCTARAQTISGYVSDSETLLSAEGAVVMASDGSETHYFEVLHDGYYYFELYPGIYTIACNKTGYETFVLTQVSLGANESKTIDIKLVQTGRVEKQPAATPVPARSETSRIETPEKTPRAIKSTFSKNPLLGLGAGYQFGNIGGAGGSLDISLSRMLGVPAGSPVARIFLSLSGGFEKESYQSLMFNDAGFDYEFNFIRAGLGLHKIFSAGNILITPGLAAGIEQATPKSENVHELIDGGYIRVMNLQPSLSLGYALSSSLVLDAKASYYAMMKESTNGDNKILAFRNPETDKWTPWSYSDDFFEGRKGFGFMLGLKLYF